MCVQNTLAPDAKRRDDADAGDRDPRLQSQSRFYNTARMIERLVSGRRQRASSRLRGAWSSSARSSTSPGATHGGYSHRGTARRRRGVATGARRRRALLRVRPPSFVVCAHRVSRHGSPAGFRRRSSDRSTSGSPACCSSRLRALAARAGPALARHGRRRLESSPRCNSWAASRPCRWRGSSTSGGSQEFGRCSPARVSRPRSSWTAASTAGSPPDLHRLDARRLVSAGDERHAPGLRGRQHVLPRAGRAVRGAGSGARVRGRPTRPTSRRSDGGWCRACIDELSCL